MSGRPVVRRTGQRGSSPKSPLGHASREVREIIRDEHLMRGRILTLLGSEARTIPEIAEALGCPAHEVTFWVMGMRKYGWLREEKEVTDEGYFLYRRTEEAAES